ncbi:cytochrome P450 [Trichoderma aethiopicum]
MSAFQLAILACGILVVARLLFSFVTSFTSPTRRIPGPLLARFTRLWYLRRVALGRFEHENIQLHRRYGPIVRLAPNMYSIDLPEAVNKVYGIGSKLPKSDWYDGWKHPTPDAWTMFPDKDIRRHAQTRRVFQGLYSMSSLVSYEGYVNECADVLLNRLSLFSKSREPINMGHWFQCYAFDVIGNITFSKPFGFLDRGEDVSGLLQALQKVLAYSTLIGIYSSLHPYIFAVCNLFGIGGAAGRTYLAGYVKQRIRQRQAEQTKNEEKTLPAHTDGSPEDFLEKIMIKNKDAPSKVTDYHVFMMSMSNIIAGSDTTAISLSAILYYLIRYPNVMQKVREEVDRISEAGAHLSFKESLEMPYWQAVMKEALRLHPATGLPLWRTATEGGIELNGHFFPEGTWIGLNTWTAHYNRDVFGENAAEFRPERWLEAEEEGGRRLAQMNVYYLPFGLGSRTCIGRHISYLEMSKLIPLLIRNFDFELQDKDGEWQTTNHWFVKPNNFNVIVRARATS